MNIIIFAVAISLFGLAALLITGFCLSLVKQFYNSTQNALRDSATYRSRNTRLNDALEKAIKQNTTNIFQILQLKQDVEAMIKRHADELRKAYESGGEMILEKMKVKEN